MSDLGRTSSILAPSHCPHLCPVATLNSGAMVNLYALCGQAIHQSMIVSSSRSSSSSVTSGSAAAAATGGGAVVNDLQQQQQQQQGDALAGYNGDPVLVVSDKATTGDAARNIAELPAALLYGYSVALCLGSGMSEKGGAGLGTLGFSEVSLAACYSRVGLLGLLTCGASLLRDCLLRQQLCTSSLHFCRGLAAT
jgi:hypothetical protein